MIKYIMFMVLFMYVLYSRRNVSSAYYMLNALQVCAVCRCAVCLPLFACAVCPWHVACSGLVFWRLPPDAVTRSPGSVCTWRR